MPASRLPSPFTYVYKAAPGKQELCIDVYGVNPTVERQPRPVVMFFHTGFLLAGSRDLDLPIWLIVDALKKDYAFISADFRCLPDVGIQVIVTDVKDAGKFVREKLNRTLAHDGIRLRIDPGKLIIAGSGSGAYLAALATTMYKPKPVCFVSIYGMLDIGSQRYSYKSEQKPILPTEHTPVGLPQFLSLIQSGAFQASLCAKASKLSKYTPLELINERFPPSFILHGMEDRIIPISDSESFADKLEEFSVEYNFLEVEDAGHAFDFYDMTDQQQKCLAMAIEWVDLHIRKF